MIIGDTIDLPVIYECQYCKAVIDTHRVGITKLDNISIQHCPVCNSPKLKEIKI